MVSTSRENLEQCLNTGVTKRVTSKILPKRINYSSIQLKHTVPSKAYVQAPIRTEYEYVIPYKVGEEYCKMALEDGEVIELTKDVIKVRYQSGLEESYKIGSVYTTMEGADYLNNLITDLKIGSKFKAGDNIYYHNEFFEKDYLDPSKIVFKINRTANIAVTVTPETYEDSSAVSKEIMEDVTTKILKVRTFNLPFSTNINKLVKVGDYVEPNSTLFIDSGDGYEANNLSETSLSLLEAMASMSPRAKYKGVIDRIEIKYNGVLSDMTKSLAKTASTLDKELYERTKGTEYEATNNQVTGEYSSQGKKLLVDTFELKVYILVELDMGIGDKLVIANQAKTVIGEVFDYNLVGTESGRTVDMMTSYTGFINRGIDSPYRIGMTNTVVELFSDKIVETFFK